jgi:cyanophycinase-like exopeptidase
MFVIIGWLLALGCIFGVYIAHGGNIGVILHALPSGYKFDLRRRQRIATPELKALPGGNIASAAST